MHNLYFHGENLMSKNVRKKVILVTTLDVSIIYIFKNTLAF